MKHLKILIVILLSGAYSQAQIQVGSELSKKYSCFSCHGEKGVSANDEWPNLANQKKTYLLHQLRNFKSGQRTHPLMTPIATILSDDEMDKLAEYFSKLSPQ